jgi:hypothetical protein
VNKNEILPMGMTEQEYKHIQKIEQFIEDNRNDKDLASEIYYYVLNEVEE